MYALHHWFNMGGIACSQADIAPVFMSLAVRFIYVCTASDIKAGAISLGTRLFGWQQPHSYALLVGQGLRCLLGRV